MAAKKPKAEEVLAEIEKKRKAEYEHRKLQVARLVAQWTFFFAILAGLLALWAARNGGNDWTGAAMRALAASVILSLVGISLMNPLGNHLASPPVPVTEDDLPEEYRPKTAAQIAPGANADPVKGSAKTKPVNESPSPSPEVEVAQAAVTGKAGTA